MARRKKKSEKPEDVHDDGGLGETVRRCRAARGWTQEHLAERAGLSADTIRRLEHASFSPTLNTVTKLCDGFGLRPSTLLAAVELKELDPAVELTDFLQTMDPAEQRQLMRLLSTMLGMLRGQAGRGEDAA